MKRSLLFLSFVFFVSLFYSCSQGIKGIYFATLEIGTNQDQFSLWVSYGNSNYVFNSFKDLTSLKINLGSIDDSFYFPFSLSSRDVIVINQLPDELKIIYVSKSSKESIFIPFTQPLFIADSVVNSEDSLMLLSYNTELPSGDYTYYVHFLKKYTNRLETPSMIFTNVVKIDVDDQGNFYIFQVINEKLKIDIFTSSFIRVPSVEVDPSTVGFTNLLFSSVVILKPFQFLIKFDSKENFQKTFIFTYDYNLKELLKKYEILLPKENFVMLSMIKNGFVACASYKNGFPVIMGFNPFDSSFKFVYEIYIDFQYPMMMRGFKISKDGRLVVPFLDLPDDRVVFYYWDLISTK